MGREGRRERGRGGVGNVQVDELAFVVFHDCGLFGSFGGEECLCVLGVYGGKKVWCGGSLSGLAPRYCDVHTACELLGAFSENIATQKVTQRKFDIIHYFIQSLITLNPY